MMQGLFKACYCPAGNTHCHARDYWLMANTAAVSGYLLPQIRPFSARYSRCEYASGILCLILTK